MLIPVPAVPPWVSLEWSMPGASLYVRCDGCGGGTLLYATVLKADRESLTRAVAAHAGCGTGGE